MRFFLFTLLLLATNLPFSALIFDTQCNEWNEVA